MLVNIDVIDRHVVLYIVRQVGLRCRRDAVPAAHDVRDRFRLDLPLIMVALPAVMHIELFVCTEVPQKEVAQLVCSTTDVSFPEKPFDKLPSPSSREMRFCGRAGSVKDAPDRARRSESLAGSARLHSICVEGEGSVHDTLAVAANSLGVRYPSEL